MSSTVTQDSTFSNCFSLEAARPIWVKFDVKSPWDGETKVCSNDPGHMTNMTDIYGKNLKNLSSLEPKGRIPWKLVCSIVYLSSTYCIQMMTLGRPLPILRQGQIYSLILLDGKKGKTMDFSELL